MSLLDDVSIVVTPNGYKAGTLFAVKPTIAYGSELVVNGDFSEGDTGWTIEAVWTISGGAAHGNGANGSSQELKQAILEVGKTYEFSYEIRNRVSGSVELLNSGLGSTFSNQVYTSIGIATSTELRFRPSSFNGDIYNVSVREFTGADMDVTRATAATRVDENGLVNYAEVLGGEGVDYPSDVATATEPFELDITTNLYTYNKSLSGTGRLTFGTSIAAEVDQVYKIVIDITISSGNANVAFKSANSATSLFNYTDLVDGVNTFYSTVTGVNGNVNRLFTSSGSTDNNFTLNSVSVKEAVRDNVPRIDYAGGGCPHILAEPQRTNFVTTSASGSYGSAPASEILAIAPDGENTAIRPVPTSASNRYQETIAGGTYSSGDEVTYSWYRKRISTPVVTSYIGDLRVNALVNCTQVGVTTEIASSINGYDRFSATFSITDGSLSSTLRFYFGEVIGTGNSSVAYWGHQLEAGSYATSYIPTSGSTVTRNQDIFTRDGISSLINSTEGVLFLEMAALDSDGTYRYIKLSDGTTANTVQIRYSNVSNNIQALVYNSSALQAFTSYTPTDTTSFHKIAFKYKENDFALWVDGTEVGTDTSGTTALNLSSLVFSNFFGKVKQLQVYKTALTDVQLAALTT